VQYPYRKSSIRAELLKGSDAWLYRALLGHFEVKLFPVVLGQNNWDGEWEECAAFRFDITMPANDGSDTDSDAEPEPEPSASQRPMMRKI
jgi:hypothetical protein